jgi:hypothetical protein
MRKPSAATCEKSLGFIVIPLVVIASLWIIEMIQQNPTGGFSPKVSASLAMYGIGIIIPYLISDDALNRKFGTVTVKGGKIAVTFIDDKKHWLGVARISLFLLLGAGVFVWFAIEYFYLRIPTTQPSWAQWSWVVGVLYCALAGIFYVILETGHSVQLAPERKEA